MGHPGLPQADLRARGGQHPRGLRILLPDPAWPPSAPPGAWCPTTFPKRRCSSSRWTRTARVTAIPAWAAAVVPDPLMSTKTASPSTTAGSTRAWSPSTCRTWRCPPAAIWICFWKIFDERLELCHRALMCRHNRLKGTLSDAAPILWQYGALQPPEKGRDHRQAALRRLLHHLPGLCGAVRVRQVHDRQEPHRSGRDPLRAGDHEAT